MLAMVEHLHGKLDALDTILAPKRKKEHKTMIIIETIQKINANRTCLEAHIQSENTEGTISGIG